MKKLVNEAIAAFLEENTNVETCGCTCGAVTMSGSAGEIAFLKSNAPFIGLTLNESFGCNHCNNSWGVDIVDHSEEISELEEQIEELEDRLEELDKTAINVHTTNDLTQRIEILKSNLESLENS